MRSTPEKGQALLVVVLVMVIALTVGLSLASRSITVLRNTTQESDSQKAFSAAEAGIEQGLKLTTQGQDLLAGPKSLGNNALIKQLDINVVSTPLEWLLSNGNYVPQDEGSDVWLSQYSTNQSVFQVNTVPAYSNPWSGILTLGWGSTSDSCATTPPQAAALEVAVLYEDPAHPDLSHILESKYTYDQCVGTNRANLDQFGKPLAGSVTITGKLFPNKASITVTNGILMRITPVYTGTFLGVSVSSGNALPAQGRIITATGQAGTTGSVERKVQYYQGYESLPSEYFYGLFSPQ